VGLKANQEHLYRYCFCTALVRKPIYERTDVPRRGHGRLEERTYSCFRLNPLALALRWQDSGMATFIGVNRIRQKLDGTHRSEEISYFISNTQPTTQTEADELFDAIRQHSGPPVRAHRRNASPARRYSTGRRTPNRQLCCQSVNE